ncbi:hypothetical protein LQZ19_05550 [Treponema primitia]|uniref:Trm112 family protein n=1 Tax=Treponema primitia TaxID=88058 RepID=UPI00397EADC7
MAIDSNLLEILADPFDGEPLTFIDSKEILYNPKARRTWSIKDGIPVLLPQKEFFTEGDGI